MKSTAALNKYKASAPEKYSVDSKYEITLNLLHDCVIIPDFGGFICNYQSAYVDEKNGLVSEGMILSAENFDGTLAVTSLLREVKPGPSPPS